MGHAPKVGGSNDLKRSTAVAGAPADVPRLWDEEAEPSVTAPTSEVSCTASGTRNAIVPRRALLLVMKGSSAGRTIVLGARKTTIGRSRHADFALADASVSRIHCAITSQGGRHVLADVGSTHHTLVNGVRADRVELQPGDRIQLGPDVQLEFDVCEGAEQGVLEKLYRGATRDLLTSALNWRAFEERLAAEVSYALRHGTDLVAVAVAIDPPCGVEGALTGGDGDVVLREVAGVLASVLRREDVFARTTENSFVILARGLGLENGVSLARRMRALVEERAFSVAPGSPLVTICAGVGELSAEGNVCSGSELLELAGARLAAARLAGPNRVSGGS